MSAIVDPALITFISGTSSTRPSVMTPMVILALYCCCSVGTILFVGNHCAPAYCEINLVTGGDIVSLRAGIASSSVA